MEQYNDKIFKGLIYSFIILYVMVAGISCYHCVEFCMVGNPFFLSIIMSVAFEVGLALALFSILINEKSKSNVVSWTLMTLLTCVQVMGNIYSVEKYMETSNEKFYMYIQNGFLHWFTDDMPEKEIMSIIAILLGALLPFVALLMTSMVARSWKDHMAEKSKSEKTEPDVKIEPKIEENNPLIISTENTEKEPEKKNSEEIDVKEEDENISEDNSQEILDITPHISEVKDGSLLTSEEQQEMERNTSKVSFSTPQPQVIPQPRRPVINFFNPTNN